MSTQGKVTMERGIALETEGVVSNVATAQARKDQLESLNVDGQFIRPDWVSARGLTLGESIRVGSGVVLTDGCVSAQHISGGAVTTEKIAAGSVQANQISVTDLSSISANLGSITTGSIGVGSGGVTITNDGGTSGIHLGANAFFAKHDGTVTFYVNGATGEVSATKFTLIANAANSLDLTSGNHIFASAITVGVDGPTLGEIATNASNAFDIAEDALEIADGEIVGFFQNNAPASGMSFGDIWIKTNATGFPTVNAIYRYQDVSGGSSGVLAWRTAPNNAIGQVYLDAYVAGTAADNAWYEATSKITTFYSSTVPVSKAIGDLWVHTGQGNKLYRAAIAGAAEIAAGKWVSVQDAGVAAGASAVQPGGGVYVDGSKNIISIDLAGIDIYSTTANGTPTPTRTQITSSGLAVYESGVVKVQVDHGNGVWINNTHDTYPSNAERLSLAASTSELGRMYASALDVTAYFKSVSGADLGIWSTGSIHNRVNQSSSHEFSIKCGTTYAMKVNGLTRRCYFYEDVETSHAFGAPAAELYNASNVKFTVGGASLGSYGGGLYTRLYIWSSGDPTTFRQYSGGTQGAWGATGDIGISKSGSLWFKQAAGWARIDS